VTSIRKLVIFFMLLVIPPSFVNGESVDEDTRVGLVPISARTDRVPSAATTAIDDTLMMTLQFLRGYTARQLAGPAIPEFSEPSVLHETGLLGQVAMADSLDYVIFGSANRNNNGDIVMELHAFNRATGTVAYHEREIAEGILDLFDASDRLIAGIIEQISNIRVQYGRLEIVIPDITDPHDTDSTVIVAVDGIPVSEGLRSVTFDRMVAGAHDISITRDSPILNWNRSVTVHPGETTSVYPLVPAFDGSVQTEIDRGITGITVAITTGQDGTSIISDLQRIRELISGHDGYYALELRAKLDILQAALSVRPDSRTISNLGATGFPVATPFDTAENTVQPHLIAPFTDLAPSSLGTQIYVLRDSLAPYGEILIDGDIGDWAGIPPVADDPTGDVHPEADIADITAVYLAMNEQFLFVRYSVPDGRIPSGDDVRYDVNVRVFPGGKRIFLRITPDTNETFDAWIVSVDGGKSVIIREDFSAVSTGPDGMEARFPLEYIRRLAEETPDDSTEASTSETIAIESFSIYRIDPYFSLSPNRRSDDVAFSPRRYILY